MNMIIVSEEDVDGHTYWGVSVDGARPSVWFLTKARAVQLAVAMGNGSVKRG